MHVLYDSWHETTVGLLLEVRLLAEPSANVLRRQLPWEPSVVDRHSAAR